MSILSLIAFGCGESRETRMQRFLAQGNDMVTRRDYEQALYYYNGALKFDSCFADALNNIGTVYHKQRDFKKAAEFYGRAIVCNPQYAEAYFNRANSFFESNDLRPALRDLRTSQNIRDTVSIHFLRGLIYSRLGEYDSARESFRSALKLEPENPEIPVNIATVLYYQGRMDSARAQLATALNGGPAQANAFNTLSMVEAAEGNYAAAMKAIDRALELEPAQPYFLNNRGYIQLMTGQDEEAVADINRSIEIDPYNGWAYRNKGIYYLKKEHNADALRMFRQAVRLDPTIEKINYYLGEALWRTGERTEACRFFEKARERRDQADLRGRDCK